MTPLDRSFYISFLEAGLTHFVDVGTFIQPGHILDPIFSSNVAIAGNINVPSPFPRCMHCPVLIKVFLPNGCKDHSEPISIRKLWSKGNYSIMCQELQTLHYESMFEGSSVEEFYIVFLRTLGTQTNFTGVNLNILAFT